MTRKVHALAPPDRLRAALCGAKSRLTDNGGKGLGITCERCIRILTKRIWVPR